MSPITNCLKKKRISLARNATKTFKETKQRMTEAPIMILPDFSKVFEITCDPSGISISRVLG